MVSPSDCAVIALAITKKLRKNISETTIKRLYGFAAQENQFSKFTINTLLEFIDNGEPTAAQAAYYAGSPTMNDWDYLLQKAKSVSETTVKIIMNTCTIPYEFTVDRKFATYDIDYFYHSTYSFTVFVAQAGYGKSIMLSHLVKNQFLSENGKYANDVICFLHASKIFNLDDDQQQLTVEIQKILGLTIDTNFIDYFNQTYQENGKKLVIIIDGFSEICQNNGAKPKVFSRLLQLFDEIQDHPSIKVILSMRSYIWRRFFERIRQSHYLKTKWFPGSYHQLSEQSNVPALTDSEVSIVLEKLNAKSNLKNGSEIKSLFRHPFYLSYYYMLQESYANTDYLKHLISYEVVLRHVLSKIYRTRYGVEKVILCKKIIRHCKYGRNGDRVNKSHLLADENFHKSAYMELLLEGILAEEQRNDQGMVVELVHFVQPHIFDYFLFKEIYELHDSTMCAAYFRFIFDNYQSDRHLLLALLKWSTFKLVKHKRFYQIKNILNLDLTSREFNQLLLFLSKNIKHQMEIDSETKDLLSESTFHKDVLQKLATLDFLDPCYQQVIPILIRTTTDHEVLANFHALMILFNTLTLNVKNIEESIFELKKLNFDNTWEINPLTFAECLLHKLTGKNNSTSIAITDLTVIEESLLRPTGDQPSFKQMITTLCMVHFQGIFGSSKVSTHLLSRLQNTHHYLRNRSSCYSRYLLNIWCLESARRGLDEKTTKLLRILNEIESSKFSLTNSQCCSGIIELTRAHQLFHKKEYENASSLADGFITTVKNNGFIALEIMARQLQVKIFTAIGDVDKANEGRLAILTCLENTGLYTQLFELKANCLMPSFDL